MARLAFVPVRPFMLVVLLMTGVAIHRGVFKGRCQMAFLAFHLGMFPDERKPRLVMVERCFLPQPVIVTVLAFRALLPSMFVVFLMTGIAIHRGVFISIVRMAALAWGFNMFVSKPVAGLVVVETDLLPIPLRMAIRAGASHFPVVLVVFLVTTVAVGRRVTILDLGLVTSLTLDLLCISMGASEREVRSFMIEGPFRNRRNVLCSAFMFRMAVLAFPLVLEAPVKTLLLIDIFADIFMAIETQGCLRRFVESLMAFGAGVFPLGMALDHLPRHQGGFDVFCPGRPGEEEGRQDSGGNDGVWDAHGAQRSVHIDADDVKNCTGG